MAKASTKIGDWYNDHINKYKNEMEYSSNNDNKKL